MRNAGLTDLQVNGYAGVDFNSTAITADAMDHALHAMLLSGVTTCLPTLITAAEDELTARLACLDRAVGGSRLGPLMVPGYHLEGPFLSPLPGYAGCHPAAAMVAPDSALLERLGQIAARPIAMLTLAPEREGAIPVIAWAKARGIVVALGHTAADATAIALAVAAGAALSTHLGNALPQPQPKFLNPMMAQLAEDGLSASFIADGIHIPRHVLKVLVRAKGLARCVLVTDATAAAAAPPGLYDFAGMTIEHTPDGSVRVPGGQVLAGSALCLDQAVRNAVAWDLADTATALAMASSHPDALLGGHQRRPPSTNVVWSGTLHPERVSIGGLVIKPGGSETP